MSSPAAAPVSPARSNATLGHSLLRRLERIGDYCNAIVVKEVRQSLKSRQFIGTFLLLLLVAWGGSIFYVSMEGDSLEYGSAGGGFFYGFFLVLCFASLVIVPYAAFRSIVEERAENTLELIQITALSPRQIVWGKSLSALVQVLVYFSAIAPFVAFTSLLPGFDFIHTTVALAMLLTTAFTFSSVALAIGAQTKQKISQAFGSLGVIVLALIGMSMFAQLTFAVGVFAPLAGASAWWMIAFVMFLELSTAFLCQQVAVAQLTFESDNRSSGIRLTVTAQWLISWLSLIGWAFFKSSGTFELFPLIFVTTLFISVAALYVISERDGLSRRVSRGLSRSRLLRTVWVPFLPGGSRGLLFGLGSLAALIGMAALAQSLFGSAVSTSARSDQLAAAAVVIGYSVIYMGAGAFLTRLLRRVMSNFSPGHLFAVLVLLNLVLMALEFLWHFLTSFRDNSFQAVDIVNPFVAIDAVSAGHSGSALALPETAIFAVLAVMINWRAMWRAVHEVVNNPVRAQIELEAARRKAAQAAALQTAVLPSATLQPDAATTS
jgi:hypothetical protein